VVPVVETVVATRRQWVAVVLVVIGHLFPVSRVVGVLRLSHFSSLSRGMFFLSLSVPVVLERLGLVIPVQEVFSE